MNFPLICLKQCRYCLLWGPWLSRFCSPSKHTTVGEKASTHWREVIPYKYIFMCFLRWCGISMECKTPFLGHYNPITTQGKALATSTLYLKRTSQLRLLVIVNKTQIYPVNTQCGTHHTPTHITQSINQIGTSQFPPLKSLTSSLGLTL